MYLGASSPVAGDEMASLKPLAGMGMNPYNAMPY